MAQADGTIIIDTEIRTDGMTEGSKEVEAAVRRMAKSVDDMGTKAKTALNKQVDAFVKLNSEYSAQQKKVDELKRKVAEYANQKIPTDEYREIQLQIEQATQKMNRLIAQQERFKETGGKTNSSSYKRMQYDIEELANEIKYAQGELRELEATNKAFTSGSGTKQAAADMEKLAAAEQKLSNMNNRLNTSYSSIKGRINKYKNSLLKTDSAQKKTSTSSKKLSKSLKDTGKSVKSANMGIGKMLGTSLLFSFVFRAISAATNAIKEGFTNLAQYSGSTNNSISMLWSSLERLKNSLATAFAPILNVVAPILSKLIDMLSTAASYVSMFFAFLSGKSTYTKAVAVQKDYAASLNDTAGAAGDAADATDKAAEAAEGYLSPLDEINKMDKKDTSPSGGGSGGSGGGGAGGGGSAPMFEEVEITDIPILEKVKDILQGLFKPFKQAWEAEGKNTVEAAKYAFSSLGELAQSVGKSFYEVWTNGTGTQTLTLILQIAQNILYVIGNIATKFREAWETNNIGTQIIQNIFNLLNIVLGVIERISGATAEWAATLDFTPLLTSINNLLLALQPLTENIGAGLEWFWNNVLLPIAGWTIQEAVPAFLDLLSAALSTLNEIIVALQPLFTWLWDSFLQPLAEWTGDLIISALTTLTDLLTKFGDWISEHQEAVQNLAIIVGSFAAAWALVNAAITIWNAIGVVATAVTTGFGAAVSFLTSPVTIAVAIIGSLIAIGVLLAKNWDEISAKAKKVWDFVKQKFQEFDDFLSGIFATDWSKNFGILGDVLNGFFANVKNIWNSIKQIFSGIITFVKGVFTGNWRQAWEGVKQIFSGVFNGLKSIVKAPINAIIGLLNGAIGGLNVLIRGANKLPFVNIPTISKIPYLASGAVIPPNREFMAVLGDQKHGTNIETPEALLRKIMREELSKMQTSGGGGSYSFTAQLNRRTLFEEFIKEAQLQQMRTGKNPLEFA